MVPLAYLLPLVLIIPCTYSQSLSSSLNTIPPSSVATPNTDAPATALSRLSGVSIYSSTTRQINATATTATVTEEVTHIVGIAPSGGSANATASRTTSAVSRPTVNTQPCNGYVEFCNRKFSNVSMVVAHNSPFVKPHNAASNQIYPVLTQLQDGIRGLQFETHMPNETSPIRLCHTSCNLLDVGLLETYLATVKTWLDANPYEVIAIMMGNNNDASFRITPQQYAAAYSASGILEYIWTPPARSMNLTSWPTLSEMILKRQRVVVMLDYNADQTTVPWLLDEWNYQWQTPFSPTNPSFPCTQQRPPGQSVALSRERMYMLNHNLNINVSLQGIPDILIPAYSLLNEVNAVEGNASVGLNVRECTDMWNRPPNWILVDYYNFGNFNGSVFEVAAEANGVPFRAGRCCGGLAASKADLGRGMAGVGVWGVGGLWTLWFWLW